MPDQANLPAKDQELEQKTVSMNADPCGCNETATQSLIVYCPAGCGGPYVVQPGDTVSSIARIFNTTTAAILACNPQIQNVNLIIAGQLLCVPGAPAPPQPCPQGCGGLYIIQPGDTLFGIAQAFNTNVQTILACNPQIQDPNLIFAGTLICVPQGIAPPVCPPGCGNPYTVQRGDTLFLIARRFGTTVHAILACNPQIKDPNLIFPGQVICVPGA